jgi:hypothetical protein
MDLTPAEIESLKLKISEKKNYNMNDDTEKEYEYKDRKDFYRFIEGQGNFDAGKGPNDHIINQEISEKSKDLLKKKLQQIRIIRNDDDGFQKLVDQIEKLEKYKNKKEEKLKSIPIKVKGFFSPSYKSKLQKEISDLDEIISDIKKLIPIYEIPKEELEKISIQGGAKTKKKKKHVAIEIAINQEGTK